MTQQVGCAGRTNECRLFKLLGVGKPCSNYFVEKSGPFAMNVGAFLKNSCALIVSNRRREAVYAKTAV